MNITINIGKNFYECQLGEVMIYISKSNPLNSLIQYFKSDKTVKSVIINGGN